MPKQNRPLVRDGRIQAKKKRTDRSYLAGAVATATESVESPEHDTDIVDDPEMLAEAEAVEQTADDEVALLADTTNTMATVPPPVPIAASPPRREAVAASTAGSTRANRLPTTVRAMQQQGVRKRREFDLQALAQRDTSYAYHELRRIAILATMVVITLVILGFVLR